MQQEPDWVDAEICETRVYRDILGSFMTGVTVVAGAADNGERYALTANSFTSVSLDPPLVLVCLGKSSGSLAALRNARSFSINILADSQRDLASAFASRGPAKSEALAGLVGSDPPYLAAGLATLCCRPEQFIEAGDHVILIGRVLTFTASGGQPLGYFKGGFVAFGLGVQSLEQLSVPLRVGGLLATNEGVLLCRRPGAGAYEVPTASLHPGQGHNGVIRTLFEGLGIEATASFPYSVFQESRAPHTTMVFTVDLVGPLECGTRPDGIETRLFGPKDEPWRLVEGAMMQGMLERFFKEQAAGCFGLYCDTADGGRVAPISSRSHHWSNWEPGQALPDQRSLEKAR